MGIQLLLSDGVTAINLAGTAPVVGVTYAPDPPARDETGAYTEITETAQVVLRGSLAEIQTAINSIERLLHTAGDNRDGPEAARVYVHYAPTAGAAAWRSRVFDGRVVLPSTPGLRRFSEATLTMVVAVIWQRSWFWETADEVDAGTVHVLNGDVAGSPAVGQWIGMAGPPTYSAAFGVAEGDNAYNAGEWSNIEGVLATPVHLRITNDSGASIATNRVWIANDVYARFDGAQHQLAGAGAVSWTGASAHSTARWTITPTAAQIAKMVASGGVRLLAVMASVTAGVYLRAQLQQVSPGPTVTPAWTGPEALTVSGRLVYDLGYVQMPPGVTTFDGWYLVISIYAAATGAGNLDFVQMCPGRDLVALEGPGLTWADDAALDWWGDERYAAIASYHASLAATGRLLLQPARPNRLQVLVESATGVDVNDALIVQVKYRPRRATI